MTRIRRLLSSSVPQGRFAAYGTGLGVDDGAGGPATSPVRERVVLNHGARGPARGAAEGPLAGREARQGLPDRVARRPRGMLLQRRPSPDSDKALPFGENKPLATPPWPGGAGGACSVGPAPCAGLVTRLVTCHEPDEARHDTDQARHDTDRAGHDTDEACHGSSAG